MCFTISDICVTHSPSSDPAFAPLPTAHHKHTQWSRNFPASSRSWGKDTAEGSSAPASATCPYRSFWASVCPCSLSVPSASPAELCAVTDLGLRHTLLGRHLLGQDPMSCEPQLVSTSEEKLSSENRQFYFLRQQSAVQCYSSYSPHWDQSVSCPVSHPFTITFYECSNCLF